MPLPPIVRVRISSEAAESISLTPVVVQEISFSELMDHIITITGKDAGRICEILRRGSVTAGGSRFRWQAIEAEPQDVQPHLERFPDPDPSRPFQPDRCSRVILRGERTQVLLLKEAAQKRRPLRKESYWDVLMQAGTSGSLEYAGYSYRERADRYRLELLSQAASELSRSADLLAHDAPRNQIRAGMLHSAEFWVER